MNRNTNKIETNGSETRPRRRWLNIGPGIVIALAISALVGSQWIKTETGKKSNAAAPILERRTISSSYDGKSGPTPGIDFIIDRAAMLRLRPEQIAQIKKLHAEWNKRYEPKLALARQAAEEASKELDEAKGNRRTPVTRIEESAAPVIALSGEISAARRDYWNRAVSILDPHQRESLQAEREADWTAKLRASRRG